MTLKKKFKEPEYRPIDGVSVHPLKVIPDERGRLMEIMRCDDPFFTQFGQVYLSTVYTRRREGVGITTKSKWTASPDVRGMVKAVLYDDREGSPTRGCLNEIYSGEHKPCLIVIPAGVYHGWKCISEYEAYVINVPSRPYNRTDPDEYRVHPHTGGIPYDWSRKDG